MNSRAAKKYKIPDYRFAELRAFTLQYPSWKRKLEEISVIGSSNLDGLPRSGKPGNPTERIGMEAAGYISKITLIENCARDADPQIQRELLYAVTHPYVTYKWLSEVQHWLYCGRDKYYLARLRFYWLLDKRKDET